MQILEIYQSRQGEGLWTGNYSVFVRTLGCHLRCRYCDTSYAWAQDADDTLGADLSPEEIAGRVMLLDLPNVVLTGGEPMLSSEIVPLTKLLKEFDYQVTIETSGTIDAPVLCDLMSISPKLNNSFPADDDDKLRKHHVQNCLNTDVIRQLILRYNYQLKFVIDTPDDLNEAEDYLKQLKNVISDRVFFMPQATDSEVMAAKAEWIVPYCEKHGYHYCPRMQIIWYGNTRRT